MSKSSDQVVLERRLKPIYDAIDAGNNKKAIQEAEKVLKKHPNTLCAKVLKALAMIRSDRVSDAWPLIDEVDAETDKEDVDENTLQAMCHCFKEAYAPERISILYERVCKRFPHNEQYLTHLFMSYVRVRNYKMQQKTAITLYKDFQRNPYYFWNVMSIVMQAISSAENLAQTMLFPLAEKMVCKMIDSNSIQAEAECDLYLLILEGSHKYERAAAFLESDPLCRQYMQQPVQFLFYRTLKLHKQAGNHAVVLDRCFSKLMNEVDDWSLWTFLFDSAFDQMKMERCSADAKDELIERLVKRVLSLVDRVATLASTNASSRVRGPYLARLNLIQRLLEERLILRTQLGTLDIGEPMEHLVEYVELFHDKPCCFADIRPYVSLLGENQVQEFLERIKAFVDRLTLTTNSHGDENLVVESTQWADIVYRRLCRALGRHRSLDAEEKRRVSDECVLLAERSSNSALAAAAYAQISAHLLWDLFTEHEDWSALYELTLLMEWVYSKHASDPLCRLVLCRTYACVGAVTPVRKQMQSLDIKYVQMDTLGYLLFGLYERYGRFNLAIMHFTELSVLFDQTEKEISECLTTAYKGGNFAQIPRLVKFLSSITKSISAVGADVESRWMSACFAVSNIQHVVDTLYGDEESIDFPSIEDNRDLSVIPSLNAESHQKLVDEEKRRSFLELVDLLQLRHLLLRCVASISRTPRSPAQFATVFAHFRKHLEYCKTQYKADSVPSPLLQAPPAAYLCSLVHGPYLEVLEVLLSSAVKLTNDFDSIVTTEMSKRLSHEESLKNDLPDVESFRGIITKMVEYCCPSKGAFCLQPFLRHCSCVLQILALAGIALKLMEMVLESALVGVGNRKNKKSGPAKGVRKHAVLVHLEDLRHCIEKGAVQVDTVLAEGQSVLRADDLIPSLSAFTDQEVARILLTHKDAVDSSIISSYSSSLDDMREAVQRIRNPPWR